MKRSMDFLVSGRIRGSNVLCLLVAVALFTIASDSHAFRWEVSGAAGDYGTLPGTTEWYTTLGNNLQVILHTSGQHRVWVEQKAVLWPRGSGEKLVSYPGLWYGAIGDFSDDEKQDTVARRHNDSAHNPGRFPTNFWWRETGKYYEAQADLDADGNPDYPEGALDLKVSIRNDANKGPDAWPPEFRADIDGDGKGDMAGAPIIMSDEDVICIHHARWNIRGEFEELDEADGFTGYGGSIPMQFEERIMSFGHPAATDIQFHLVTVRNASRWHFYAINDDPSLGPVNTADQPGLPLTDFNCVMVGQYANTAPGDGPFYAGYQPATRLLFSFDRDFIATGYRASTAFFGIVYLHTPEVDGVEIPMTVATSHIDQTPWHLWTSSRVPTDVGWNMIRGQLNMDRQSPGPNPGGVADPMTDSTVYIANWSNSLIHGMAQSDDLTIPPDSAVQFDFAYVASLPVNNPVPDNSDAGIAREAAGLVKKTLLAYQLYNTGYRLPKAPAPPNLKIIPGDRKVTLTWDDIPIKTPDPFLPGDDPEQGFRQYDFEGFRVYRSRTGQIDDAELLAQYDLKNGITLETGVLNRMIEVIDGDGNKQIMETEAVQDTVGASAFDTQKRYGLGTDTGLKFTYVDQWDEPSNFQRLTNGFRYFYMVTSYDWNQNESLESSLVFTEANMTVPRSDANTYSEAEAKVSTIVLYDGAGNELDPLASSVVPVELGLLQGEAVPTNAYSEATVEVSNAELITAPSEYRIKVDSIVGGPGPEENHLLDPAFDYFAWQTVYVSLLDPSGHVVGSAFDQMKIDLDEYSDMGDAISAHFYINPTPDSSMGVPFAVEFELQSFDFQFMQVNPVEILVGSQELGGDFVSVGFNSGNQNTPAGFRAADFEIEFVAVGADSVTLVVHDITHNVDVPFMDYPGAGWCFYGSWSRFTRLMREVFRDELTYDDIYGSGPKVSRTIPNYGVGEYPLSSDARVYLHLCGLKMELKSKYPPKAGDKWLVRTNYGDLPPAAEDGTVSGDFSPKSPRPPVAGVSYGVKLTPDNNSESNRDMSRIKVVPNPFIVTSAWDQSPLSKQIQFTHLPAHAEVRIYTLSGHLVQVLQHDGITGAYDRDWQGGTVNWNLQNRFNSQIASGWYIWHCKDLDTGEVEMGKFAVIQ